MKSERERLAGRHRRLRELAFLLDVQTKKDKREADEQRIRREQAEHIQTAEEEVWKHVGFVHQINSDDFVLTAKGRDEKKNARD
jgi:hypothetical protein